MKLNKKQKREAAKAAASLVATATPQTLKTAKAKVIKVETSKVEPATSEKPKKAKAKPKSEAEVTLDKNNATAVVKKITEVKDLKYVYADDCDTLAKRKKFRAEVRRKMAAFEKEVLKYQNSKEKEDIALLQKVSKEADSYASTVYATHS